MIRPLLLAASAALTLSFAAPGVVRAQEAPAAVPAYVGLTPESVREWLVSVGAQAGEVTRDGGDVFFRVDDAGVVWFVFFYSCGADGRCGDLQFNTVFDGTGVTAETVNTWNREQRWLKAFSTDVDGAPVVFLQLDVLIHSGQTPQNLGDAGILWLEGIRRFADHLRAAAGVSPGPSQ